MGRLSMRLAGRERLGFYPLPIAEGQNGIRTFLQFPETGPARLLDPCIGEGRGVRRGPRPRWQRPRRYGIELEAQRAAARPPLFAD